MFKQVMEQSEKADGAGPDSATPTTLELGDGSRLVLAAGIDSPILRRLDGSQPPIVDLNLAQQLEGQPFAGYERLDG